MLADCANFNNFNNLVNFNIFLDAEFYRRFDL